MRLTKIQDLLLAKQFLKAARKHNKGAPKTKAKVQSALKSIDGAIRNARRFEGSAEC